MACRCPVCGAYCRSPASIAGKLLYTAIDGPVPQDTADKHYFCIDDVLVRGLSLLLPTPMRIATADILTHV